MYRYCNRCMTCYIRLIILLILSHICISSYAIMLDDSTIVVLTTWKKNEHHIFSYSRCKYEIKGVDTIKTRNIVRSFNVLVDDSTQHLYSLKYVRLDLPSMTDSIPLDEFPLRLMTNCNGALMKILNWEGYLAWRNNNVETTSNALFPYVSMLSFNGKKMRLNHHYRGMALNEGDMIGVEDSIKSESDMVVTQDFQSLGNYELITVTTTTKYSFNTQDSPIPIIDKFTQVIDSNNGWPIATYFERRKEDKGTILLDTWNIKLID